MLVLGTPALRTLVNQAEPYNRTPTGEPPNSSSKFTLNQLVFGFGVPLGVLSAFHSLLKANLQLARLTGGPRCWGCPGPQGPCCFYPGSPSTSCFCQGWWRCGRLGWTWRRFGCCSDPWGSPWWGPAAASTLCSMLVGTRTLGRGCAGPSGPAQGERVRTRQMGLGTGDGGPAFLQGPEGKFLGGLGTVRGRGR